MNNNMLRTPLIKSALLLAGLSLIIYLTITSGGSVLGSLQAIVVGIFRGIQLVVGLFLALFLCIAVLIGIFLGGMAMVSRETAARMANQLRDLAAENLQIVVSRLRSTRLGAMTVGHGEELRALADRMERQEAEIRRLGKAVDGIRAGQAELMEKFDQFAGRKEAPE
ncbi:MAG TPA: hypothetical protein ENN06_03905 [Desulfobacteraceae bacterium]|nr:hypothetical protein [Desulfobacteraceae bacterium]